jgi:transcription initiation factor IIF auxiliary subunit
MEKKKKMFEKYIIIKDKNILAGQTSNGVWYCKELPAENTQELDLMINEVNTILNKYNNPKQNVNDLKKKDVKVV